MISQGRHPAAPKLITLGGLSALAVGPELRHVRWASAEVLMAVQVAMRDANWGTIPPKVTIMHDALSTSTYSSRWLALHDDGEVQFEWEGRIRARGSTAGAELCFEMDGTARAGFAANRIGICLLHPLTLTGGQVELRAGGSWHDTAIPEQVSPDPIASGFDGLRYRLPDGSVAEFELTGELFETEDQRNWTDASLKSYCPPLAVPFPRSIAAGDRIRQTVTLRITARDRARIPAPSLFPSRRGIAARTTIPKISIGSPTAIRLPAIGTGATSPGVVIADADMDLLRALGLRHLHAVVDTSKPSWAADLSHGLNRATSLRCPADLEVVAASPGDVRAVAEAVAEHDRSRIGRIFLYDKASSATTEEIAAAWPAWQRDPLCGGSRANFAELNRAGLPLARLDAIAFAINPQVHASDDESVMQTLAVHPTVTKRAAQLAAGRPVVVGPVTLRPRFNAVATGPPRLRPPDAVPEDVDVRQAAPFAAAWLLGSIAALAPCQVLALTYFELAGPRGLLAGQSPLPPAFPAPGTTFPAYEIFAHVAPHTGRRLLAVNSKHDQIAVLALDTGGGPLALISNLRPDPIAVRISVDWPDIYSRLLFHAARPAGASSPPADRLGARSQVIDLGPYQTSAITATGETA
jgi:D-apionolactonase